MEPQAGTLPRRAGLTAALALALAAAAMLFVLHALSVGVPAHGLDASWIAVLGQAATTPARWGVDLAFTYGPASALVTRYYTDAYLRADLPVLCGVALVQGLAVARLAQAAAAGRRLGVLLLPLFGALEAAGLAAELSQDQDGFYFALAFTLVLVDLVRRPGDRVSLAILAAGAALLGVLALSKTSYGVVALALFVIADARAPWGGARVPFATPVFLAAALATFLAYGQRLGDLGAYLDLQGQVAAGYGEAMYLIPGRGEILAFLVGALALVAGVGFGVPARVGRPGRAAAVFATLVVLAIAFKAGFIRADTHSQIAWATLGLAGLAAGVALVLPRSPPAAAAWCAACLGILWIVAPLFLLADSDGLPATAGLSTVYRDMGSALEGDVGAWARFLRSPSAFAAGARAAKLSAWAAIRAAHPLPALAGSVDIIPSEQTDVLAAGLDYRPRPSFQDYSTYTAGLIAANVAFYAAPDAPAWVLWGTGGLDDRYPAMTEGASWPELLRRYEPVRRVGDLLALHRRAVPLPDVLGPPVSRTVRLGERIALDETGPLFARITVRETLLGRLAAALFRPPALGFAVTTVDGETADFRLVPAIAAGGFLLSPGVSDADAFADLGFGTDDGGDGAAVTGLAIGGSALARFFYDPTATVELRPLTVTPVPPSPEARALYDALAQGRPWRQMARGLGRAAAFDGDHLSVPAPGAVTVPVAGGRRLRLTFGIEDGAWTEGHGDGVCFAVVAAPGSAAPLWQRCLDPRGVPGDRGPQSATVDLPPGLASVTAETRCRASCAWGWSYWSGIAAGD